MIAYLTHYYRKGSPPFRSLSALSDNEAIRQMQSLYVSGSIFWERFANPFDYLSRRRKIEAWLRSEFIAKGGRPQADYPIYMILGHSHWADRVVDPATVATTEEIRIPLEIFTGTEISFTYPDSMVSTLLFEQKNPQYYLPNYHGKVFTLDEMRAIVEEHGMPEEGWQVRTPEGLANYIEAQVWNPVKLFSYSSIGRLGAES